MSAIKVVKVVGESQKGWEEAVDNAVKETSKTIDNVRGVEVVDMTANVENGEVYDYKATVEIAFPVMEKRK